MREYQDIYLAEAGEMLDMMEQELLNMEQSISDQGVQRIFRAAHTIKGSSATMGYTMVNKLTHSMENVLDKIRTGAMAVTTGLTNILLECVDHIKLLHEEISHTGKECSSFERLATDLDEHAGISGLAPNAVVSEWILQIGIQLSEDCTMPEARLKVIEMDLAVVGSVLSQLDSADNPFLQGMDRTWLFASSLSPDDLKQQVQGWTDVRVVLIQGHIPLSEELEPADATVETAVSSPSSPDYKSAAGSKIRNGGTIRVNVDGLENLMNLVGELVIEQTRLVQVTKELVNDQTSKSSLQELGHIGDRFGRLMSELQENVLKTRMLPIEQLFSRLPRLVRDLSQTLDKDVELLLEGQETELDRTLMEELGDPLIHLIRNALDHGLEQPSVRVAAGKRAKGLLKIGAYQEGNHILVRVEDDGAGINTQRLLQKAVDRGIMTQETAAHCTVRDAIELIFHPGLSTASSVSGISGRGVGMDIVRNCIEKINGMIEVETQPGKGTVFSIRLPLTLAIGTGLLVKVEQQTYIIPMSNVAEIIRITPEQISTVKKTPILRIRDRLLPIVWLHDAVGKRIPSWTGKHIPVVIIGRGEKKAAVIVEQLLGNQEIVIKPLGGFVGQVEQVAGATILGNGKVALILETSELLKRASRSDS